MYIYIYVVPPTGETLTSTSAPPCCFKRIAGWRIHAMRRCYIYVYIYAYTFKCMYIYM